MKVAIIGAGFTGLSASYFLQKKGHKITIFERDILPGGLALGYKEDKWKWTLEQHYHHWFTNDKSILNLANEIHHPVIIKRPKTSSFVDEKIFQLDSPLSLLKFPMLSLMDRIRTGFALGILRYNPFWKPLEKFRAVPYLKKLMGNTAYKKIWEPLMVNKLGSYASVVSLAWFWARIYKRTPSLAYPKGGFLNFAIHLENVLTKKGVIIHHTSEVTKIDGGKKPFVLFKKEGSVKKEYFDKIIVTVPSPLFIKITPSLPEKYVKDLSTLKGIGAINLILRLSKPFFSDNTYWLNMCALDSPILAIVEHTNYMHTKNYNNEHVIYIGNYNPITDVKFSMSDKQLLSLYHPYLIKINPEYKKSIIGMKVFKAPFAQPIIETNYSKKIPPFKTPLENIFLANIQQVYPWDRGTNYAVELGEKIAAVIDDGN